jgi:hypothetical protein
MSVGTIADDPVMWDVSQSSPDGGGPSPIAGVVPIRIDPTMEYVAGGSGYFKGIGVAALPDSIDDLTVRVGYRGYDAMLQMPAVGSSVRTLVLGAMAGEIKLAPTFPLKPGKKTMSRDEKRADEAVKFCQRLMNRVPNFRSAVQQLCSAVHRGNKLAEMRARIEETGPDAGRLVLDAFNVKSHSAWQFIVNSAFEVVGILFRDEQGVRRRAGPEKFAWLTWMPEDNDPRGRSILRAAYHAWNLAIKLYPQYYKYLCQFAVASLIGEVAENDTQTRIVDGKVLNPNQYFKLILERFQNGSVVIIPHGARVIPVEVSGEGLAFLNAFEHLNREIVYAILMQTRATMEAQNGSKADSETSTDVMDLLVGYLRDSVSECLRHHVFYEFLRLNYGQQYADAYTPYVLVGAGPAADKVEKWKAAAPLINGGAITPSIQAEFYADAELPVPDPDADAEAARAALEAAQAGMEEDEEPGGDNPPEGDPEADTEGDEDFSESWRPRKRPGLNGRRIVRRRALAGV